MRKLALLVAQEVLHLKQIRLQGYMNNNKMGDKGSKDDEKVSTRNKKPDSILISGYQLHHNYLRTRMALEGKPLIFVVLKLRVITNG